MASKNTIISDNEFMQILVMSERNPDISVPQAAKMVFDTNMGKLRNFLYKYAYAKMMADANELEDI